jgi:hypothetical protein
VPKERFHIYLADRLVKGCDTRPPKLFDLPAFFIGAVSPDIFYYDLPFFSLPPLGDWIHRLIERDGISIIFDWISEKTLEKANGEAICWGLGFACHFMVDATWHPLIDELSRAGLGLVYSGAQKLSPIERHRLIESEIEAFWLAGTSEAQKSDYLRADFWGRRGRIFEIASHYLSFLEFAGAPGRSALQRRISWCLLCQNFLLRLFANKTLARSRDLLLSFAPTRFLGALVVPVGPILPELFARATPEQRNPFSDSFMQQALATLKADFCGLVEQTEALTMEQHGRDR